MNVTYHISSFKYLKIGPVVFLFSLAFVEKFLSFCVLVVSTFCLKVSVYMWKQEKEKGGRAGE